METNQEFGYQIQWHRFYIIKDETRLKFEHNNYPRVGYIFNFELAQQIMQAFINSGVYACIEMHPVTVDYKQYFNTPQNQEVHSFLLKYIQKNGVKNGIEL